MWAKTSLTGKMGQYHPMLEELNPPVIKGSSVMIIIHLLHRNTTQVVLFWGWLGMTWGPSQSSHSAFWIDLNDLYFLLKIHWNQASTAKGYNPNSQETPTYLSTKFFWRVFCAIVITIKSKIFFLLISFRNPRSSDTMPFKSVQLNTQIIMNIMDFYDFPWELPHHQTQILSKVYILFHNY